MEREESNKLIAEFMGAELGNPDSDGRECYTGIPVNGMGTITYWTERMKFHTSWDWIMPVVEKIERIKDVHFVISELGCDIYSFGYKVSDTREETKILTIYKAVVEFIQWYNEQALGK